MLEGGEVNGFGKCGADCFGHVAIDVLCTLLISCASLAGGVLCSFWPSVRLHLAPCVQVVAGSPVGCVRTNRNELYCWTWGDHFFQASANRSVYACAHGCMKCACLLASACAGGCVGTRALWPNTRPRAQTQNVLMSRADGRACAHLRPDGAGGMGLHSVVRDREIQKGTHKSHVDAFVQRPSVMRRRHSRVHFPHTG